MLTYATVCSGIEAPSVAWRGLGWRLLWLSEIDPHACAVLAHHYPGVPNHGDMLRLARAVLLGDVPAPDLIFGGTPCQDFSVAGLRAGMEGERGNLTAAFVRLCDAVDHVRARAGLEPAIIGWENVPGVLSSDDNAFGSFVAALAGGTRAAVPGPRPAGTKSNRDWRWSAKRGAHVPRWSAAGCVAGPQRAVAWRSLDAQYLGLAQRRERVFALASARDGFDPAAVLFEFEGVRRDSPPSRTVSENIAGTLSASASRSRGTGTDPAGITVATLDASYGRLQGASGQDANHGHSHLVVHDTASTLAGGGHTRGGYSLDDIPLVGCVHGTQDPCSDEHLAFALGRNTGQENVIAFDTTQITSAENRSQPAPGKPCHTLNGSAHAPAIAFKVGQGGKAGSAAAREELAPTLGAASGNQSGAGVSTHYGVRRLTPVECERLQGEPDGYTAVPYRGKPMPDGPRYKMLGNSIATNCLRLIGARIQQQLSARSAA